MLPDGLFQTFLNTFGEWHYFAGGAAVGFLGGFMSCLYVLVIHRNHHIEQRLKNDD